MSSSVQRKHADICANVDDGSSAGQTQHVITVAEPDLAYLTEKPDIGGRFDAETVAQLEAIASCGSRILNEESPNGGEPASRAASRTRVAESSNFLSNPRRTNRENVVGGPELATPDLGVSGMGCALPWETVHPGPIRTAADIVPPIGHGNNLGG